MEDWISLSSSSCEIPDSSFSDIEVSESSLVDIEDKKYFIQGQSVILCKLIENIDLSEVLTVDVWSDLISDKDKQDLIKYLPENRVNQTLEDLFTHQIFHIFNPIQVFSEKIRNGVFSKVHYKHSNKLKQIWEDFLYRYTTGLAEELPKAISNLNYNNAVQSSQRKKLVYHNFSSDSSSDESLFSIDFENCTSGESTILDEEEEAIYELSERNKRGEDEEKEMELKRAGNIDWVKYSLRFKDLNIHKNQLTIKMSSLDWIENYRRQETERYKNPTQAWSFQLEDGTFTVVSPISKKITSSNIKPRDHQCLKSDRPGYLTLLSLTRDAAARLPDGVGTRADICQLVRDSQFIVESASDTQISNLVSGALDRLHYEKDPCVKYDTDRKLWMYLHRGRGLDYFAWKSELPIKRGRPTANLPPEITSKEYWPPYLEEENLFKKKKK
jgi:hypothetical protein